MEERVSGTSPAGGVSVHAAGRRRRQQEDGASAELTELIRSRVEEALRQKGMRKGDLARALAVRPNHLWGLLSGNTTLSLTWISRIAAVLGVSPAYLLSEGDPTVLLALTRRPIYRHLAAELTRLSDDDLMSVLRFVITEAGGERTAAEQASASVANGHPPVDGT